MCFIANYVMPRAEAEQEYLERFAKGDYQPSLLFGEGPIAEAAQNSPEAQWKLLNLKKDGIIGSFARREGSRNKSVTTVYAE